MNPLAVPFRSDLRNCGGRSQIEQLMYNHKYSLTRVKPVLKIQAPHPHIKKRNSSIEKVDTESMSVYKSNHITTISHRINAKSRIRSS